MSALSPAAAQDAGSGSGRPPRVPRDRLLPLGAAVSQLVTFGVVLLLARVLKADGVGLYIQAYAVLALLSSVCLAGLRGGLSSAVALRRSDGDEAGLRGTIFLGLALPTAAAGLCAGMLFAFAPALLRGLSLDPRLAELLRLAAVALVFHIFTDAALAATRGFHTTRYFALISLIVEPVIRLLVTADLVALGVGIRGALIALVASNGIAAVLAGLTLWRLLEPASVRPRLEPRELNFAPVSWLGALATTGLIWGDVLLIGALRSTNEAGVYAVATRLVALAALGLPPILAAATPALVGALTDRRTGDLQQRYATVASWMARLALPGLVALLVLPRDLLALFGPGFPAAATATVVLAAGKLLDAGTGPTALMLTLNGRASINVADNVAAVLLNVGLNLYLIPRHGIVGAAIAWAVSIWMLDTARVVQVWWLTGLLPFSTSILRALVAGNAALLVGLLVSHFLSAPWRLPVALVLMLMAYLAVSAELGLSREEAQGWREVRASVSRLFART